MSSAEITIIKRDGKRKAFSVEKIKNAIRKAFLSVGAFATEEDLVNILSHALVSEVDLAFSIDSHVLKKSVSLDSIVDIRL